jgi:hypothetical protein
LIDNRDDAERMISRAEDDGGAPRAFNTSQRRFDGGRTQPPLTTEALVTEIQSPSFHLALDTAADQRLKIGDRRQRQLYLCSRVQRRSRERVFGVLLERGGLPEDLSLVRGYRQNLGDGATALGQRAGLVEPHDGRRAGILERSKNSLAAANSE